MTICKKVVQDNNLQKNVRKYAKKVVRYKILVKQLS